jgi:phosphatidylglycerophosphate synthase
MPFDIEKMHKLPPGDRFFDFNTIWYFFNRWVIRVLYTLPITANQITWSSLLMGLMAAGLYLSDTANALVWAAFCFYGKIFLDNVDGNLARVRGEVSRVGRFLDSFTDFVVTVAVYGAITFRLAQETSDPTIWVVGFFALLSGLMHCTYFVFYLVHYTSRAGTYQMNRVQEDITDEDREESPDGALFLQRVHGWFYGWQDRSIELFDAKCRELAGDRNGSNAEKLWYQDKLFLSWISPLCLCTNNMILVIFSLLDRLEMGLYVVLIIGNAYLLVIQTWKVIRHRRMSQAC